MNRQKTAVVTGATGKIGGAIAEGLLQKGFKTIVLGRNAQKIETLLQTLGKKYGDENLSYSIVDLSSRDSIAGMLSLWTEPVDILVNNAACTPRHRQESVDAVEMQWATNVLAYYRLMKGLAEHMKNYGRSRIVNVASYWAGGLDLSDPEFLRRQYNNDSAYRQSKQADRMLTAIFAEKLKTQGIAVNACHPGDVNSTLSNNLGFGGHETPVQGADNPLFVATDITLEGETGLYFEHRRKVPCTFMSNSKMVHDLYELCESYS